MVSAWRYSVRVLHPYDGLAHDEKAEVKAGVAIMLPILIGVGVAVVIAIIWWALLRKVIKDPNTGDMKGSGSTYGGGPFQGR
jgi:hypothetical protein